MEKRSIHHDWLEELKEDILSSTYWGKLASIAHLLVVSTLLQQTVREIKLQRKKKAKRKATKRKK